MPLDPVIQEIIKSLPPNDFETLTPEEFRIGNGDYSEGGGEDVDVIEDRNLLTADAVSYTHLTLPTTPYV